jgi:hypothetical protein
MKWLGFCIKCQRSVQLDEAPGDGGLPDCPVCSAPVVALAGDSDKVPWVVEIS